MGLGATLKEAATSGLASAVTGGIGSIVSGGLGLLGGLFKINNNGFKNQQKLMQQAWLYAEDKGIKWVKGFEVIGANTVNKDYYERLLKEKNENGISLHGDNIEEIERKKAINQMEKLQNLTNRKKAKRRQIRKEEEDIMYQYLSAEYCPF